MFTVNANGGSVVFSKGNLQYIGSAETPYWKFAEHQWDYLGTTTGQNSQNQNVDRDLFGWGTSGYNHGATAYQPWSTSITNSQYYAYGNLSYNLYDQTGQADWGYNAISNGGNQENSGWRTLTKDEWGYLFNTRSTPSGIRYAKAKVNDVNGVILLPDDWNANYYTLNSTNTSDVNYTTNTITATQWATLEQFGAAFLPAAGERYGTSVYGAGSSGYYWSSSYLNSNSDFAWDVYFFDSSLSAGYNYYRDDGQSVRLVFPSQGYSFGINASPSPAEGGAVSGHGAYQAGAECTLTATASAGYSFVNWTENGIIVSTDASYTFVVLRDRNLLAHFAPIISEGGLSAFTVNANGGSVVFSKGNLQYIGSAETPYWKFAEHQWVYFGTTTGQNSSNQNVDRDLFGWGTSGYNHGATAYQPWSTSTTNSQYYAYGNLSYNLYDQTGQADWGYNAISNGGNQENSGWRTLTKDEWGYLFNTRSTPSGIRYVKANVNNVNGVILLPDDWNANYYPLNNTNSSGSNYTSNVITAAQWATLEQFGAAFLPAAGYRSGTLVNLAGSYGRYWSSSYIGSNSAWRVDFDDSGLYAVYYDSRILGQSVRLVFPSQGYSFAINATPNPAAAGAVSGAGAYQAGAECTLTATASAGYSFANWTENGIIVSTDASYTFVVLRDRNLVANFVASGNIVFADADVKALCVANWDTNDDGELSYVEAANVTSLGEVFKNNTDIHSFNELQYFIFLVSIGNQAFYGCSNFTAVTIPEQVTSVGNQAFYGCSNFTAVTIPEQVTSVGNQAFWNCPSLQTVTFNAIHCTSMQSTYNNNTYSVFSSNTSGGTSALTRVAIGNQVTRVPDHAFQGSSDIYLRLVIPASVTEIGNYAFDGCSSIPLMLIQGNGLLAIGEYAFRNCSALASALNLPNSVTSVGQYAFYGCILLPSLTVGEGVTTIGGYAFWNCPVLTTVHFNAVNCTSMVTNSQYSVFNSETNNGGATPIVTLSLGENVTNVPDYAFRNSTNLTSDIIILDATTNIGQYAFHGAQSQSLTIGEGVNTIGGYAFWNCPQLATVHFNATNCTSMVTNSQYSVFNSGTNNGGATPIVTLNIGDNVTRIPDFSFRYSSNAVGTLTLPESLTSIGQYAFDLCSGFMGDLTIPNAVETIGQYAFSGCSGFNGILSLPVNESFNIINQYTFNGCSGLTGTLTIPDNVTEVAHSAFRSCSGFTGALLLHDAMTTVGDYAFNGCSNIPELTIGEGMNTIGGYAFWNCPAMATVHFNAINCTSMNTSSYSVFNSGSNYGGATPIVTLTIGDLVTAIPNYAFRYSSNMVGNLIIPDAVISIGQYAFANCSGHNVFTGKNTTTIANYAFQNSNFNGTLRFGDALASIGSYAFDGCNGFTGHLVFPNSVTSVGSYAFRGCSGFNGSLVLGSGISTINDYTFSGCSGFTESLIIGRAVNSIGNYSFQNCSAFTSLIAENPAPISATNNSFTGMTYTIPVHVPFGLIINYQNANGWKSFTNYKNQFTFEQLDNADWSDAQNWYTFELPGPNDVVCVNSNCNMDVDANVLRVYVLNLNDTFTVNSDQTLEVNYGVGILQASQLVLEEGCQLYNNLPGVHGTVQLNIGGNKRDGDGWFTIAAPIYGGAPVCTLTTGDYDLFAYDEPTHYWKNQKVADNGITTLNLGQGYLYANQTTTGLSLSGELNPSNAIITMPVTYEGAPLEGYTLVGNPYTNNLSINDVQLNGTPLTTYYKVNGGSNLVAYTDSDPIRPGEGFLVMVPEGGTLTFTPSRGQSRNGDMPDVEREGEPVGFRLPAHNDLIDVDAYNGETQYVNITVTVNADEGGTVTGGGSYAVGSTCTLTAVPNELYAFVNWTCNGVSVSTNPTYSFTVMGAGAYTANFAQSVFTQTTVITPGWNWWSTYIDQSNMDGLTMLENALGNNGLRVVSHKNGYVEPLEVDGVIYWYGTLSEITNEQMYMIMTNASCSVPLTGGMVSPSDHPITINSGWNWIGYPSNQSLTVNEAMTGFEAEEDDIIKSRINGYANYHNGSWYGTLSTLNPGSGYMYKSNSSASKTLVFQQGRGQNVSDVINERFDCFGFSSENYKDNMTVTAVVELDGVELHSADYELVAFAGDECRGSVKLMYVETIDRYVAFLTVLGEAAEPLRFALVKDEEMLLSDYTTFFEADAALGSLGNPMKLCFSKLAVGESLQPKTTVFPNPVKEVLFVEGTGLNRVEVFNAMGQRVVSADAQGLSAKIDLIGCASGVYLVRVTTENGMVTHHIIKE